MASEGYGGSVRLYACPDAFMGYSCKNHTQNTYSEIEVLYKLINKAEEITVVEIALLWQALAGLPCLDGSADSSQTPPSALIGVLRWGCTLL